MSTSMYIAQSALIAGALYMIVWRQPLLLRMQVIGWAVGVIGIWLQFGEGQLGFYSNDQVHYASIVRILVHETWPRTIAWWLDFSKIPYPAAAVPLALAGVNSTLSLKVVSLLCLLVLTAQLLKRYDGYQFSGQLKVVYLTGCGLIGGFFSTLALRETMMMLLVYRYTFGQSLSGRVASLGLLFLLRSHLALALAVAELALAIWKWLANSKRKGYLDFPALILIGVTLGTILFTWRFAGFGRIQTPFTGYWGIKDVIQVSSNFAGLQFLTSHEAFVKLSVSDLLLLRVVFSDTLLIPLGFTIACLLLGPDLKHSHKFTLLAFTIYVSIVTSTDFNSFRQNIPLMPLMGIVVLDALQARRLARTNGAAGSRLMPPQGVNS